MKKNIVISLMFIIFIAVLGGCSSTKSSSAASGSTTSKSNSSSSNQAEDSSSNEEAAKVTQSQEFKDLSQQDKDTAVKLAIDLTNSGIKGDSNMINQTADMDLAKQYPETGDLITEYTRQFKISNVKSYTMEVGNNNSASEILGVYAKEKPQGAFDVSVDIKFHVVANDGTPIDSTNKIFYFMVKENNGFKVYGVSNYYNLNPNSVFFKAHSIVYEMFDNKK